MFGEQWESWNGWSWGVWDGMAEAQVTGMEKTYELIVPFLHFFLLYLQAKMSMVFSSMAGPGNGI